MAGAAHGALFVVGTPLGNLRDGSPRAREVLEGVDAVLAEDTRITARLLSAWGISKPLERADAHELPARVGRLVERLASGERLALVSDAGMPCISDPGVELVDAALSAGIPVEVVPGPSAVASAVAVSGLHCARFLFQGFLSRKGRSRAEELGRIADLDVGAVIYESPHRVPRTLEDLAAVAGERRVALCRELTKLHEEVLRGTPDELLATLREREEAGRALKGECVLVVEEAPRPGGAAPRGAEREGGKLLGDAELGALAEAALERGLSPSRAARELARELGVERSRAYEALLAARGRTGRRPQRSSEAEDLA